MNRTPQHGGAGARRMGTIAVLTAACSFAIVATLSYRASAAEPAAGERTFRNPTGVHTTFSADGMTDDSNPFFQDLGTNGRSCSTCHRAAQAWTVTPIELRDRFERTGGFDPIFRTNDGSNCEGADVSTADARRRAFSLLLTKGLIRVALDVPPGAEFEIVDVDDPYRCDAPLTLASMYRRPLPTTNLAFASAVMWDGRQTEPGQPIRDDLLRQARGAVTGHAEGAAPSAAQLRAIVDFELAQFTAQSSDRFAGSLSAGPVNGGASALAHEPFCIGINDPLNILPVTPGACESPSGGLNPVVFTLFRAWADSHSPARRAIARGEEIFNTRQFVIDDVPGLNGRPRDPVSGPIQTGTCTVCHNTPNAGDHSIAMPLNIGVADVTRRAADLPLYMLRNLTTGDIVRTTDPGRAMVTGRWDDIGKFKGPVLRGLAARAPYFHDGSAASLADVVAFYDTRFHVGFTEEEKADLIAFLQAL